MKVAANDVERTLQMAKSELAAQGPDLDDVLPSAKVRLTELQDAFARADELRSRGMYWRRVKGRKNGKYREVLATTMERPGTNGRLYIACIVPYTEIELNGRRITTAPRRRRSEAPYPQHSHLQWVERARLEAL